MKTNYNKKLIMALHSVFWYQCLLDEDDDNWIVFPVTKDGKTGYSRPEYQKDSIIIQLIDELRSNNKIYAYSDIVNLCPEFAAGKEFNVIWIMLVEMFGSCGTSPRTGWITDCKDCADFLQLVVEYEERNYYGEFEE